jgi:VWFA-related protein
MKTEFGKKATATGTAWILVAAALAQQQPARPPQAQTPPAAAGVQTSTTEGGVTKFSITQNLVVETVSVLDKNGKPIEGLKAEDFKVTENGVAQTIKFCEFQKFADDEPVGAPAGVAPAFPAPPKPTTPPPPGVVATAIKGESPGDIKYRDRRLLVLYFDMSAMPVPDQLRAFSAAQKYLKTQIKPADLVAMMKYDSGAVRVLQDFTDDRDALMTSLADLIAGEGMGLDENDTSTAADTGAAFGQDDGEFNLFNTDRQLAALQTAVTMLGALNEKKSVIYFASGLRLNGLDNQAQLRATLNAAIRANVAFFPVDARGLVAQAPLGDATRGSMGGTAMYTGGGAMNMARGFQQSQDTLYALAADTGGKALLDYNDLSQGIVNAQKAYTSYYIIGYYTTNQNLDGKFRKVNVSLKEYATAKLDYRQGYFAGKEFGKFNSTDKERQLEEALMLGDPVTDLTIAMEVNYFQLNHAEYYVPVVMKIPGSEIALAKRGGAERALIDFIGEIKDEYGSTMQNIRDKVDLKIGAETAQQLAKMPIEYDTGYTLLPGKYTIKVLARENETGRLGTYMTTFVIPNLNKEDKRVPISSVVLSSQRIPLTDALYTAGKDKAQVANPLVQDGQKLIPSVTRVFSKSRDMYVYLQAYEPGATSVQPIVAFLTFYRGQQKAFETPPLPVTDGLQNSLKTVPLKFSLALNQLVPGRYNCQVTVIDPNGGKASYWQAPVVLVP